MFKNLKNVITQAVSKVNADALAAQQAKAQALAIASAKKKKEQEDQAAYTERLRRSSMGAQAMKKGGAVKKKVTIKAKPVVKAKARKK